MSVVTKSLVPARRGRVSAHPTASTTVPVDRQDLVATPGIYSAGQQCMATGGVRIRGGADALHDSSFIHAFKSYWAVIDVWRMCFCLTDSWQCAICYGAKSTVPKRVNKGPHWANIGANVSKFAARSFLRLKEKQACHDNGGEKSWKNLQIMSR